MIRIAIAEDYQKDAAAVSSAIRTYCLKESIAAELHVFPSGEALLSAFFPGAYNLVLLDIYMPGLSGLETARRIRAQDEDCMLVFITVSRDHALEGYGVQAVGYVVKPVTEEGLSRALLPCKRAFSQSGRYIEVLSNKTLTRIPYAQLRYAEVYGKSTLFHTVNGDVETRMPLDEAEKRLSDGPFLRVHRYYLINKRFVETVLVQECILRTGERIPIRRAGRAEIRLMLAEYLTGGSVEVSS